jgi:serine protease
VAGFSQKNRQVELAAPGVGVLSTVPQAPAVTAHGADYFVDTITGSAQAMVSGLLVDGGLCLSGSESFRSRLVLCQRGTNSFAEKVAAVASTGGLAALIFNNVSGPFTGTLNGSSTIPAVAMRGEDGLVIQGRITASGGSVSAAASTVPSAGYAYFNGTSMATPHVAGVAALVWSANPAWTNKQLREALTVSAEDLGAAGRDSSYGFGLVRAAAALDYLQGSAVTQALVHSIVMSTTARKSGTVANAAVTMKKSDGYLLAGASVTGCFSDATSGCSTKTTGSDGKVSFSSGTYKSGTVKFCVTAVAGYPFDASSSSNCLSI